MPRDANGNVTLPVGNPVVADTDITASWGNTTMADLATMAQDSLSRSGKGGMLVPFKNLDGTVAAPGMTFTNQTGTGFYRSAAGVGLAIAGVLKTLWAAALTTFKTAVKMESTLEVTGRVTATAGVGGLLVTDIPATALKESASSGNMTPTHSITAVDVDNCIATNFVSLGGHVKIELVPDGSTTPGMIYVVDASFEDAIAYFTLQRSPTGAAAWTTVGSARVRIESNLTNDFQSIEYPPSSLSFIDAPGTANGWDYKLKVRVGAASTGCSVFYSKLVVYQL